MNSSERIKLAIDHKPTDRIPVLMISRDFSIFQAGFELGDCLAYPEKYVSAELQTLEKYECDGVWDLHVGMPHLNELYGAKLTVTKGLDGMDQPAHAEPILHDIKNLNKLKKESIEGHSCMDSVKYVNRELKKRVGKEIPVFGWAPPPFRTACMYLGIPKMMIYLIDEPNYVLELMELCLEQSIEYSKILIDSGADYVFISNPTASATVISKLHYERYVHPFTKRFCESVENMGRKVLFHICGKWNDRLELLSQEHVAIFHVDKINVREGKEKLNNICIMGNVKTVQTLLDGTEKLVQEETIECLKDGAPGGGYILSGDCVIPPKTPKENFRTLVQTGKTLGIYPLNF